MKKAYAIEVRGRVQGVGFRYHALSVAKEFKLNGFVRNLPDGSVYAEIEGEDTACMGFVEWCRQGPARARVDRADVREIPPSGCKGFEIR